MSLSRTVAVLAWVGCAGTGLAQATEFADLDANGDGVVTMQEAFDRDGDGTVSLGEAREHGVLLRQWQRADRDRSETLDRSEFGAFVSGGFR